MSEFLISAFKDHQQSPRTRPITWAQLVSAMRAVKWTECTPDTCPSSRGEKCPLRQISCWSPAAYPPGSPRSKRSVGSISLLVLDLDHLTDDELADARARVDALHYFAHPSHSDREGDRCWRFAIELSEPVLGPDWERFWRAAVDELGVPADEQTKDASRVFYSPSRPTGADYEVIDHPGEKLDVRAILARAAPAAAPVNRETSEPVDFPPASADVIDAARSHVMRRGPATEGEGGDAHTYSICCTLVRGWALTDAEAWPILVEWNATCRPPWSEPELRTKMANARSYAEGELGGERRAHEGARLISQLDSILNGGEVEAAPALAGAPARADRRTTSIYVATDQSATTNQAETALAELGGVYVRGRALVHVVRDRSSDWLRRPHGAPVIEQLPRERLRELLGLAASWHSWDSRRDQWRASMVPAWVVETMLARGQWAFPALEGVVDAPVLRPDGSILDAPGYDAATRLIYEPGAEFPPMPATPNQQDAERALGELLEPFCDFPFVAPSDRAATASMILSVVARAAIDGCVPMFGSCAPTPGSGKGKLVDVASIIATGRPAPKMANTTDDDETRKRLLAIAIESPPIVMIDNVEGELGSPSLAMALTAGEVRDRVLGSTRTVTASLRPVWSYTGNNVSLRGDLGRRVVPIDLDPRMENPEDREGFRHADVIGYARDERPRLVVAALTILRAFYAAGRPRHGMPAKGSFESWDRTVRGAVIWAGGADPLGGVERIREQGDSDLENLRVLLRAWRAAFGDRGATAASAVDLANPIGPAGDVAPEVRTELRDALAPYATKAGKLDATALGYSLRKLRGRIAGGLRLEKDERGKQGVPWRVVST